MNYYNTPASEFEAKENGRRREIERERWTTYFLAHPEKSMHSFEPENFECEDDFDQMVYAYLDVEERRRAAKAQQTD